jgi:arylsulfatase A-like enzyme
MNNPSDDPKNPARRDLFTAGAALLGSTLLHSEPLAAKSLEPAKQVKTAPESPPAGYNILFILVDQEHYFPKWPFPVPARETIKKKAITFLNHQAASCVCSSARSVIYTGQHIQETGVFDNLNYLWQPDMSTKVKTVGARLNDLGYHAAYQGKWHLSYNMVQESNPVKAPMEQYQKIIDSYGFQDFFGVGDITDGPQGGYSFDQSTSSTVDRWLRTTAQNLKKQKKPWYLAVNFVNPHDAMWFNSDLPNQVVQGKKHAVPIMPAPNSDIYKASWTNAPLPASRHQSFTAPGRPEAHAIYQTIQNVMLGEWPDEDRRWRALLDYYFNCIRDCDRQVELVMQSLRDSGLENETIVIFTADHGELGGAHQMRGKGTNAYKEQNHLPLMIIHPAYPGGKECHAITSQLDLTPTIIGLTGKGRDQRLAASTGLKGKDFSSVLSNPESAKINATRPASLFNFDMLSYQSPVWAEVTFDYMFAGNVSNKDKIAYLKKNEPNFHKRVAIRSSFDGRYRFTRYFSPLEFNTPKSMEELLAKNDIEVYDLQSDPDELNNLALDLKRNGDLILALNQKANKLIAEEVGVDDGKFLPLRNGKWYFPPSSDR